MGTRPNSGSDKDVGGRPSKFTPDRCALIVDAISHRVPYEYAAEANGITEKTLYNWIDIARKHQSEGLNSEYTVFLQDIKRAEMNRIIEHNNNISYHVDKWQGDAWILERRWHKHYSANAPVIELNKRMDKIEQGESKNEDGSQEKDQES